jgi:hypothetical protein
MSFPIGSYVVFDGYEGNGSWATPYLNKVFKVRSYHGNYKLEGTESYLDFCKEWLSSISKVSPAGNKIYLDE